MYVRWDLAVEDLGETQGHCRRGRRGQDRIETRGSGGLDAAGRVVLLGQLAVAMCGIQTATAGEEQIRSPSCHFCARNIRPRARFYVAALR